MTHDPLCRWQGSTEFDTVVSCDECDLIAKVREDTIAAVVQRVEALPDLVNAGFTYNDLLHRTYVIAAVKGDQP